jgi:hypothetical protein
MEKAHTMAAPVSLVKRTVILAMTISESVTHAKLDMASPTTKKDVKNATLMVLPNVKAVSFGTHVKFVIKVYSLI